MEMRRKAAPLAALVLALALLLAGCRGGNPLPDGMEEEPLLAAGRDVMLQLVGGDYEAVHGALRADVAEGTTVEDIRDLVLRQLDGAGVYKQISDSMATGQTTNGETYGVAVLYCEFSKEEVLFRLAFDAEMDLIGIDIRQQ